MASFVALLRGINVGGRNKVPMAALRDLCAKLGWSEVQTYIQSGNLVFHASGTSAELEAVLEKALEKHFGFAPAVIVRSAAAWKACVEANPFPEDSAKEPNRVLAGLSKRRPDKGSARALQERAGAGERVMLAGGTLWFHYPAGVGTSKLSPALIDRLAGSPVTARNWRTMLKLQEMIAS
jgi:uncharacterized protein (DUF1697 family)